MGSLPLRATSMECSARSSSPKHTLDGRKEAYQEGSGGAERGTQKPHHWIDQLMTGRKT